MTPKTTMDNRKVLGTTNIPEDLDLEKDLHEEEGELEYTYEKLGALKLEHTDKLSQEWKNEFIEEWEILRKSMWEFDLMCDYQTCAQIWYWGTMALIFSLLENQNGWYIFIGIFCGFAISQFMFVFSHMIAHAEFLYAYPSVKIWKQKTFKITHGYVESKSVVKYWAFYHHHATKLNDWFPFLSSHTAESSLTTQMIHLHTFTLLFQPYKWLWCVGYAYYSPGVIGWLIFGFNLSAFYLWMGHDWSHDKELQTNCVFGRFLRVLMTVFSAVGINAAREDHFAHHIHNHKYVYTDFSIGETLFPWFMDHYFNKIWNSAFERSTQPDGKQNIIFLGYLGDAGNFHNKYMILLYLCVVTCIQYFSTPIFSIWATLYMFFDVAFFLITFLILLVIGEFARDKLNYIFGYEN